MRQEYVPGRNPGATGPVGPLMTLPCKARISGAPRRIAVRVRGQLYRERMGERNCLWSGVRPGRRKGGDQPPSDSGVAPWKRRGEAHDAPHAETTGLALKRQVPRPPVAIFVLRQRAYPKRGGRSGFPNQSNVDRTFDWCLVRSGSAQRMALSGDRTVPAPSLRPLDRDCRRGASADRHSPVGSTAGTRGALHSSCRDIDKSRQARS